MELSKLQANICATCPRVNRFCSLSFLFCPLRSLFTRLPQLLQPLLAAAPMSAPEATPFDPLQPSEPVAYPIDTLEDLRSRSYFKSFHYPYNVSSVPLESKYLPDRGRVLVCHDMQGGYVDDKWVQGGSNPGAYAIWHWHLIDIFVYFSHHLVTLPPPCWTNTAHRHGVKVLGTFITEWDEGRAICDELLSTKESAQLYAERLAELAVALGFDGWLINMEVELDKEQIPNLMEFVSHLTKTLHSSLPGSQVIWYDSVTTEGALRWQNQLNEKNKPFFDICDGIFINYTWTEEYPKASAAIAGDRNYDVYMGIDVFGRGTFGGGQWTANVALDVLKKDDVSAAIFAPGWIFETNQPPDFETAQNRWWALIEKSWGIEQSYPKKLPFYSNFDQGRSYHFSIDGNQVSAAWNNISNQALQPCLEYKEPGSPFQVHVDFKGASYSGGGNITFKGTLEEGPFPHFTSRLFQGELPFGDSAVHFTYSVKSEGNSLVGLFLEFSSPMKNQTIVIAPQSGGIATMTELSRKSTRIIVPHRVLNPENAPDWVVQESIIAMNGFSLTEIHALCYIAPKQEQPSRRAASEFHAVLGHISITTPDQTPFFPSANSWLLQGRNIKWGSGSEGTEKSLSVELTWKPKEGSHGNGSSSSLSHYNIYVEKLGKNTLEPPEFLGTAQVEAFYVSDLAVADGVSSLRFIVQICRSEFGICQELGNSPSFLLSVEGI